MNRFADATDPVSVIHQMIGAASVCWETPEGAGVFQSSEAIKVADEGIDRLRELGVVFP